MSPGNRSFLESGRPRQVNTVQEVVSEVPEASERNGLAVVTELEPQLVTNIWLVRKIAVVRRFFAHYTV